MKFEFRKRIGFEWLLPIIKCCKLESVFSLHVNRPNLETVVHRTEYESTVGRYLSWIANSFQPIECKTRLWPAMAISFWKLVKFGHDRSRYDSSNGYYTKTAFFFISDGSRVDWHIRSTWITWTRQSISLWRRLVTMSETSEVTASLDSRLMRSITDLKV